MDSTEAKNLAEQLIVEHGLLGWSFKLNKNKRQLGVCKEYARRIELSEHYIDRNATEMIVDTILHEIAHALVGASHGHDAVWKAMCMKLGCTPKACDKDVSMPDGDWRAQCQCCRKVFNRHKKPMSRRGYYCTTCGPELGRLTYSNFKERYRQRIERTARSESVQLMLKIF